MSDYRVPRILHELAQLEQLAGPLGAPAAERIRTDVEHLSGDYEAVLDLTREQGDLLQQRTSEGATST